MTSEEGDLIACQAYLWAARCVLAKAEYLFPKVKWGRDHRKIMGLLLNLVAEVDKEVVEMTEEDE